MPIISVITDPGIGGTFLTWSLAWLSGQQHYLYFRTNSVMVLPDEPLTDINAHNFRPNQPITLSELKNCYSLLVTKKTNHAHFVYFHNLDNEDYSYPPDPALNKMATDIALANSEKCIVLKLSKQCLLYKVSVAGRSLSRKFNSLQINLTAQEQNKDFLNFFYGQDQAYWRDVLQLNDIWDQREFLALNLRPFDQITFNQDHLLGKDYFSLHATDCWFTLEHTLHEIFEYLETPIDNQRWDHWLSVYRRWQRFHVRKTKFIWYFDDIIDAILNGNNFDLGRLNLDLFQEATIQHVLLYKHNLNLKSYNVDRFHNTAELHDLLEPNTHHTLEKIY